MENIIDAIRGRGQKSLSYLLVAILALCAAALPSLAAVPADGGEWAIGAGESETLDAAATISRLAVDGSLTLDTGAALGLCITVR